VIGRKLEIEDHNAKGQVSSISGYLMSTISIYDMLENLG
jgi:hypothetical protein